MRCAWNTENVVDKHHTQCHPRSHRKTCSPKRIVFYLRHKPFSLRTWSMIGIYFSRHTCCGWWLVPDYSLVYRQWEDGACTGMVSCNPDLRPSPPRAWRGHSLRPSLYGEKLVREYETFFLFFSLFDRLLSWEHEIKTKMIFRSSKKTNLCLKSGSGDWAEWPVMTYKTVPL